MLGSSEIEVEKDFIRQKKQIRLKNQKAITKWLLTHQNKETTRHQNLIVKNPTIYEICSLMTIARIGGKLKHTF